MPAHFEGTPDERIARLKRRGRHCIAINGHCVNAAVDVFEVVPIVDGQPDLSAPVEIRKTCGRHRLAVLADKSVHVVQHRKHVLAQRANAA